MTLFCHNCQQRFNILSSFAPKCPACRSQAVEFVNQDSSGNQNPSNRQRRTNLINENQRIYRSPFSQFGDIEQMFNRRTGSMFQRSMFSQDNQMDSMFGPNIQNIRRMMEMNMRAPSSSMQMPQTNPFVYRQVIRSPNGTTYYYSSDSSNNNESFIQQALAPIVKPKPNVNDFPKAKLQQQCWICHVGQNQGVMLPCGHKFHKDCLVPWFQMKDNCPCCRHQL